MASQTDYLGNAITTTDPGTIAGIDDFSAGLLGYEMRLLRVLPAAKTDQDSCLASIYATVLKLLGETMDGPAAALPYITQARAAAAHANDRECRLLRIVELWAAGDLPSARKLGEETLAHYPRDLVLLKLLQYLGFILGDPAAMLRAAELSAAASADIAAFHGMRAFALEECQLIEDAKAAAETAIRLQRREPWSHHALAHIALTEARIDEGSRFLESVEDTWTDLTSFMSTHLWWHRILFYLSQGRFDQALAIYDRHCWGIDKGFSQDQIGAVSLLARFELAGVAVGDRWSDLGDHLASRVGDTLQPFLTMQYLYGLARADRVEADALMQAVRVRSQTAAVYTRSTWQSVALPACEGLLAHARGEYGRAVACLSPVMPRLIAIGGSHAQRDLFELIHLDALLRTEHWTLSQQLLEARRRFDPDGVPLNTRLAEVYAKLGLDSASRGAAERARRRRVA